VANATYATSAGSATTAGTVTTAAQANITSVGTLTSLSISGNLSATGNVTGNYFIGNGSQLTGVTATSYNLITTDTFSVFIPPAGGETRFANVALNSECSQVVFQRVSGGTDYNYLTYTLDGSNPLTSPTAISVYLPNGATQRITVVGGSQLNSTLTGGTNGSGAVLTYYQYSTYYINSYNNANVATFLAAYGSNTVSTTGNVTAGYVGAGNISATGNITAANLGNIAAINLTGNADTVLYGNGTFAPAAGGGAANTGNVTFNDVNVIGTGNLNLQPNGASNEYLNIFLAQALDSNATSV
jgi:hypothetical protein